MTAQEILDAIEADPVLHSWRTERNDAAIAAALSVGRTKPVSRIITARGIAASYPGGAIGAEVVLLKLEGARDAMLASADQNQKVLGSLLRRQLAFLGTEGLDFGDATLRGMLDTFAAMSIITAQEAANLKAMALVPDPISVNDVSAALNTISTVAGA